MKRSQLTAAALVAALASSIAAPSAAMADSRQDKKNMDRNLAIGAGAVGLYGLTHHDTLTTVVGAAGAAYAGSQYEKERKAQRDENTRMRYHRTYRSSTAYSSAGRKYYTYGGHRYYQDLSTGQRVRID